MDSKTVYAKMFISGLVSAKNEEPYFSHRKCDNCNGLAGNRYEVQGYLSLADAKTEQNKGDNLYELELCEECYLNLFQ